MDIREEREKTLKLGKIIDNLKLRNVKGQKMAKVGVNDFSKITISYLNNSMRIISNSIKIIRKN